VVFDPEVEAFLGQQAKRELRKRMRALRNSIPPSARAARSDKIVNQLVAHELFARATVIGMFAPMLERNEVDVRPIELVARAQGKQTAYPFMEEGSAMTLRYAAHAELEERGNGFAEPRDNAPRVSASEGLLILVPALAVAPDGQRLGYGKGHYDRMLEGMAPPARTVAVAYDFQILGELPRTEGDQLVDLVVSDLRLFLVKP
jgi:5-formyltetrahydrofolate cyclo-ligase